MFQITLLDTIGQTCIVKMPKGLFAKMQKMLDSFSMDNISKQKVDIINKARESAYKSKGFNSVDDFFNDIIK